MKNNLPLIIGLVLAAIIFAVLWRKGVLLRLSNYVQETKEELRKCTWPTWQELWGSLGVVVFSIFALGLFTVLVDFVFTMILRKVT